MTVGFQLFVDTDGGDSEVEPHATLVDCETRLHV